MSKSLVTPTENKFGVILIITFPLPVEDGEPEASLSFSSARVVIDPSMFKHRLTRCNSLFEFRDCPDDTDEVSEAISKAMVESLSGNFDINRFRSILKGAAIKLKLPPQKVKISLFPVYENLITRNDLEVRKCAATIDNLKSLRVFDELSDSFVANCVAGLKWDGEEITSVQISATTHIHSNYLGE